MHLKDKLVIEIPLKELWISDGALGHKRARSLSKEDIRRILQADSIVFVFANIADKLQWVKREECFYVWQNEVQTHLIEPRKSVNKDHYPGNYGYLASEWIQPGQQSIVLFEKVH